MKKIVRIGSVKIGRSFASLFCKIEISEDGRLSISGVEGPLPSGNARGACGQVDMHPWFISKYAPGWDAAKVAKFRKVWQQWHLNDMQAGSPAQMKFLKDNPVEERLRYYEAASKALEAAGLNPDPGYLHEGKPYVYGSAWLRKEVPADVIEFLESLPDADKQPAWV